MKAAWRAWIALLGRREPATTIAIVRIAVGVIIVGTLVSAATSDVVDMLWLNTTDGGAAKLGRGNWLLRSVGGAGPMVTATLFWVALVSALAVATGFGGRATVLLCLLAYDALVSANANASGGSDLMITNALWLLVLAGPTRTLAVDARLRTGAWVTGAVGPAWPRYLFVLQLVVIYTATGLQKASATWTPFGGYTALYWTLMDPTWIRTDMSFVASVVPLTQIATAVTWHWETTTAALLLVLYFRATRDRPGRLRRLSNRFDLRLAWVAIGVTLHIMILLAFEVGAFSWISLAYYPCLWHPNDVHPRLRFGHTHAPG